MTWLLQLEEILLLIYVVIMPKLSSCYQVACLPPHETEAYLLLLTLTMEGWSRRPWISISVVTREVMSDSFILCISFFLSIFGGVWHRFKRSHARQSKRTQAANPHHFDGHTSARSSASSPVHCCKSALSYLFQYLVVLHTNEYRNVSFRKAAIRNQCLIMNAVLETHACMKYARMNWSTHNRSIVFDRIGKCRLTVMLSRLS